MASFSLEVQDRAAQKVVVMLVDGEERSLRAPADRAAIVSCPGATLRLCTDPHPRWILQEGMVSEFSSSLFLLIHPRLLIDRVYQPASPADVMLMHCG